MSDVHPPTLRVAMVGHGFMGAAHSQAFRVAPRFFDLPLTPVMDTLVGRNAEATSAAAEKWGWAKTANDWRDVVDDPDIDLIDICSPGSTHVEIAVAALEAGKHVLCEKPLATSYEDAAAMVKACRDAGVVMATNHHLRNAATHRAMQEAVASGRIGTPLAARVVHAGTLPIQMLGWRLHTKGAGAGALLDLLVHDTDLLRFILGQEPLKVATVAQNGGLAIEGIEDAAMSLIQFSGNIIAQVHDSFTTRAQRTSCEIHGTTGSLYAVNNMAQAPAGTVTLRDADGERELPLEQEDYYIRGCRAFHAAIRGEGRPVVMGEDGLKSLATALAARKAAGTGQFEPIRQSAEG